MDKKLIAGVSLLLLVMIVINVSIDDTEQYDSSLDIESVESENNSFDENSNQLNDELSAESLKNLTSSTTIENKLLIVKTALKNLNDQNLSLQKQLNQAENKTSNINSALNKLSDKINLIPVSNSVALASANSDSKTVSTEIVELCQDQMSKLYADKTQQQQLSFAQKLTDEPIDAQWNDDIDSMLYSIIKKNNIVGTDVSLVNCHTSICEIIVEHDDLESQASFIRNLPNSLNIKFMVNKSDRLTDNLYVMKSGSNNSYNY